MVKKPPAAKPSAEKPTAAKPPVKPPVIVINLQDDDNSDDDFVLPPPVPKAKKRSRLSLSRYAQELEQEKQRVLEQTNESAKRDCRDIGEMFQIQRNKQMVRSGSPPRVVAAKPVSLESSPVSKKLKIRRPQIEPKVLVFTTCENAVTPPPPATPPISAVAQPPVVVGAQQPPPGAIVMTREPSPDIFATPPPSPVAVETPPPVTAEIPPPQEAALAPPPPRPEQLERENIGQPARFFSDIGSQDFADTVEGLDSYKPVYNDDGTIMVTRNI